MGLRPSMVVLVSYTLAEAAKHLNVTPQTLLNWKERGWIITLKLPNGRYRIPADEIERLSRPQLTETEEGSN